MNTIERERGLHVLIDSEAGAERIPPIPTIELTEMIVDGGALYIQLRDKHVDDVTMVDLAMQMMNLFEKIGRDIPLVINDRVEVALELRRRGVEGQLGIHVGQNDMRASEVKEKIEGQNILLGVSASTVEEAIKAQKDGANYIGVGPIYETKNKTDAVKPIGIEGLKTIREAVSIPIVAIGGISLKNIKEVMKAGIDGIAVIGAVLTAINPQQATRELAGFIKNHK
jgi:thiamine-phosphate pyrophosphorylase